MYDRYFEKLSIFARGYLGNEQAAEDAVQEVFFRFIRRSSAFDTNRRFSAWIFQVTKNQCLNIIRNEENRARLRKAMMSTVTSHTESVPEYDYEEIMARMPGALQKLSDRERQIFDLRFSNEKSIREISEATGAPEGTVKSAIFYILRKISTHLKKYIHD